MKTKLLVAVFVFFVVAWVGANPANAVEDFIANGITNPISQGFLQFAYVDETAHIAATATDPQAWQQTDNSSSGGYRINNSSHPNYVDVVEGGEGWTATIQTKLISCGRNCATFRLQDGGPLDATGGSKFQLDFWDGSDFGDGQGAGVFYASNTSSVGGGVRIGNVDPTDGFHTYQVSMDANDTPASESYADDYVSIYVDGVLEVGPTSRAFFSGAGGEYEFLIGRGEAGTYSHTIQYAAFRLETGHIEQIIPEPSTLVLLASSLLGLVGLLRRRGSHRS